MAGFRSHQVSRYRFASDIPAGGFAAGSRILTRREASLKVTIDSTEPLADALRVVGALYNVNLAEAPAADDTPPAEPVQGKPARATTANPPRRSPAKTSKVPNEGRSRRSRRVAAATSREIRAWALANGHAVSDRGTLPAAVKAAYTEAHKS